MDASTFRTLLRHQAGAVSVIAAGRPGGRAGLTATAVCSVSDEPPTVLVCVNKGAGAHDLIGAERSFAVNFLSSGQESIATAFSGRSGLRGEDRFEAGDWTTLVTGAPVLSSCLASLDCRLVDQHTFATHTIFFGAVVDGRVCEVSDPLMYFRGSFRALDSGGH
ncbi:MAG: flavin reductase [Pseudomonadota bacterium]